METTDECSGDPYPGIPATVRVLVSLNGERKLCLVRDRCGHMLPNLNGQWSVHEAEIRRLNPNVHVIFVTPDN